MKKENKPKAAKATPASQVKKKSETDSAFSGFSDSPAFYYFLLGIVIIAVSVIRWRFIPIPLERDEGEYAYFGQLILNGIAPYKEAYNMKLPGIYYMYAFIMAIFGESHKGIHTGLLVMNAATMLLFFQAFKKFFNPMTGLLTAGFYGLMAMSYHVYGSAAHATHFAVFFIAVALFFLARYEEKKSILYAALTGAALGMAFLMKQQAVYFILFGGLVFVFFRFLEKTRDIRKAVIHTLSFSTAVFLPYLLVVLIMYSTGTFDRFWFWTVQYASQYATGVTWELGKKYLSQNFPLFYPENLWISILAMAGVLALLFTKYSLKQKVLAVAFTVFGILATTPGLYFRQHYFIVLLPAVALLAGITLDAAGRMLADASKAKMIRWALPFLVMVLLFGKAISGDKEYYAPKNPVALCKAMYGGNPFVESVEIAKYIKANSSETDRIAVLGSEPQIEFYADRKSATGHIYMYGLMEIHEYNLKMQEEVISEIEKNKPLYIVFCNVSFSWLEKSKSPRRIFEWWEKYSVANYHLVGLVDIPVRGASSYYWGADANRNPQNQDSVWILKRNDEKEKSL